MQDRNSGQAHLRDSASPVDEYIAGVIAVYKTYLLAVLAWFATAICIPASADEAAVRKMIDDYADAYNKHDLEAVAAFWTEQGLHVDHEAGVRTEGRDAIMSDIAAAFRENPDSKLGGRVQHLRLVKPDVAYVEGEARVASNGMEAKLLTFSAVLMNQDGKWRIHSIEESPIAVPASSNDALGDLEGLVGHWVDDSADGRVDTVFRWTADRAFLLRSYTAQTSEGDLQQGTQVIGWDPRSREIRSWSFNSDGSFGDGIWSKSGDDWLVKSSQTLPDGQVASGTYVMTLVDANTLNIQLIGHEIEGEPQPAGAPVKMTRVAEEKAPVSPASAASVQP